ncbi:CHASE3 domain-containing protein [Polaromonas sp.]|nr:CHASE3 domain-containing protein [Candidatus Saccharibacteria bacterium]
MERSRIDQLRIALVDAESGQRGYILTGNSTYLEPYNAA